jgi:hypothetical protein
MFAFREFIDSACRDVLAEFEAHKVLQETTEPRLSILGSMFDAGFFVYFRANTINKIPDCTSSVSTFVMKPAATNGSLSFD